MKRFIDYLVESVAEKKYAFKIKLAGELPEHCEDVLESALQQFQVSKFAKGKTTPIQANLIDFPNVKNAPMTVFEVELDYPTTSTVLAELIANSTGIHRDSIRVRTPLEEENMELETQELDEKSSKPLLTQDYEKSSVQDLVGEKYVSNFLKDLAKARKETEPTQVKGANDQLLAKKLHKEKTEAMPKQGPAMSLFGKKSKD
jgi:hypothetical protein